MARMTSRGEVARTTKLVVGGESWMTLAHDLPSLCRPLMTWMSHTSLAEALVEALVGPGEDMKGISLEEEESEEESVVKLKLVVLDHGTENHRVDHGTKDHQSALLGGTFWAGSA